MTHQAEATPEAPVTILRPHRGWADLGIRELWEFRELLWVLASRDIRVRYKQTLLGATWAVLQPFVSMVIFSVFFGRLAKIPSDGLPYPVFAFSALVPWAYFSQALTAAAGSVVDHRGIITKVYFPRLILPVSPLLAGLLDFGIAMAVLGGMMAWYGIRPSLAIVFLPLFVALEMVTALAVGLWLSALNAYYRDFRYLIPFLLQAWLFATPIAYPASLVPVAWRSAYGLNPMAGVIEGFRWALLGKAAPPGPILLVSTAVVLFLLVSGLSFFRRVERTFVDVI